MQRHDDPHSRRDAEKLAFHRRIAERLQEEPERVLRIARENVARWQASGGPQPYYEEWDELLRTKSVSELIALVTAENEEGQRLRQATPFTGVLSTEERDAIFGAGGIGEPQ